MATVDFTGLGFEKSGQVSLDGTNVRVETSAHKWDTGVYVFILQGLPKYVGKTANSFYQRMYQYGNPGESQQTNIRIHGLLRSALSEKSGTTCEIWLLTDKRIAGADVRLTLGEASLRIPPDRDLVERGLISLLDPEWNRG